MSRHQPYRPPLPQIPADPLRGNLCDSHDPQRCVPPLKGPHETRAAFVSYRALAPGGAGFCCRICTGTSESRLTANYSLLTANWTFTFSAKERDSETGLSYFGSRYYSSDLSVRLSVDPQAAKYPSLSPYVYCADNSVKLVDPDGEAWEVNQDGYIRQCGDENDHTLYAVKGRKDEFGDRILYKYGKLKGKERSTPVSVDVMSKMISDKTQHWDVMSRRYIEHDYTKLEFIGNRGIDEAKKLFCFLSKNTDVEWSIVGGSYQKNISTLICTSHFEKKEYMGADRAALMAPFNNLYFFFHTHPKNEIFGWLSNEKDRAVCRALACDYNSPQALFGVIHKGVFFDLHGTRILKRNVW